MPVITTDWNDCGPTRGVFPCPATHRRRWPPQKQLPERECIPPNERSAMLRLLTTIFLISASIFLYSYFRELNPGTLTVHTGPSTQFELSAVTLVVFSMAVG